MNKKKIPILDMSPEIATLWEPLNAAIQGVLKSGAFIMGPNVKAFEEEVARYLGVKHAIGVNSGTDALVIGLRAAGVCEGDEVITTPFTFFATAEAISSVGATPVFVDIDAQSYNIDVDQIERALTPKVKAILPVHLYGQAVNMEPLMALAKKHGLKVVEDVAQAMGGEYRGSKVGTIGDVGAFSFFPSKNLGAYGDGGLITTNDDKIAETAKMLRVHGSKKKYFNEVIGYNSRLDEIQAAVLRVKLPHLDLANEGRRNAAARYSELLSDLRGIDVPREIAGTKHVFHQYTIFVHGNKREKVQKDLQEVGIDTMIYYPVAMHQLPVYSSMKVSLPKTEYASTGVLSLPIWPSIDMATQETVVQAISKSLSPETAYFRNAPSTAL